MKYIIEIVRKMRVSIFKLYIKIVGYWLNGIFKEYDWQMNFYPLNIGLSKKKHTLKSYSKNMIEKLMSRNYVGF